VVTVNHLLYGDAFFFSSDGYGNSVLITSADEDHVLLLESEIAYIEEKVEEQFCDEVTGEFLTDRNIVGTCPRCGAEGAYGDQCEKCGATLSPEELINPTNKNNPGHGLVKKPTKNWYLPLGKYQDWLKQWILEGHKEWRSNVYGQCKSWLDMDLQPRAMTRDLDWGIPVPVEGAEGKVAVTVVRLKFFCSILANIFLLFGCKITKKYCN
jgi:methionyl-tRNA synthetase